MTTPFAPAAASLVAASPAPASAASAAQAPAPAAASPPAAGAVSGGPRLVLRAEGAAALVGAGLGYAALGGSWGWFALLFLLPDLALLGYLAGRRVGAASYNAAHSYLAPALLAAAGAALDARSLLLGACIWAAHVGFDRLLGYGLKYETGFGDTHLGRLGVAARG